MISRRSLLAGISSVALLSSCAQVDKVVATVQPISELAEKINLIIDAFDISIVPTLKNVISLSSLNTILDLINYAKELVKKISNQNYKDVVLHALLTIDHIITSVRSLNIPLPSYIHTVIQAAEVIVPTIVDLIAPNSKTAKSMRYGQASMSEAEATALLRQAARKP